MGKVIIGLITLFLLTACASGHCRARKVKKVETVFVGKPDGSRQCGMGSIVSLESMAEELKSIKIISQAKKNDGKMYPMVCGGPTGVLNSFEILKSDLAKAVSLGFKEIKSDN